MNCEANFTNQKAAIDAEIVPAQTSRVNLGAEQSFVTRRALKMPAPKIGRANRRSAGQSDGWWKIAGGHCSRSASPASVVELTFGMKFALWRFA